MSTCKCSVVLYQILYIELFYVTANGVGGNVYIMLFYILVSHFSEVWMCAEASHTSNKVEFHVIYLS